MMFDAPEYASYRDLMRELRLERTWETGDVFFDVFPQFGHLKEWVTGTNFHGETGPPEAEHYRAGWSSVWLPRFDQWLAMVRERGALRNIRLYYPVTVEDDFVAKAYFADDSTYEARARDCVEEAAARLWMAVTGRKG